MADPTDKDLANDLLDLEIQLSELRTKRLRELKESRHPATAPHPDLNKPEAFDLTKFDPRWKRGVNMSPYGKAAILEAYRRGMGQSAVKALFRISAAAASHYHAMFGKQPPPAQPHAA